MGDKTQIEWTDATWNPVTGCTKVSRGCKFARPYPGREFTEVRCHPERLEQPLRWKKPRRIFVNSMSDLFHEGVPFEFIKSVRGIMFEAERHSFQILTKRPTRMLEFTSRHCEFTSNVWLGVSVEDQKTAEERIPLLLRTPAAVRFVSYEPALGPVDLLKFGAWHCSGCGDLEPCRADCPAGRHKRLHLTWVIAGGESGPRARPAHPDWFRSVRDQCQAAGVPFFFKQWGEFLPDHDHADGETVMTRVGKKAAGRLLDGREWNEFPEVTR